jgi:hypothetical protein
MPAYRHSDELAALLSPRVRAAVRAAGIKLGGYGDVLRDLAVSGLDAGVSREEAG